MYIHEIASFQRSLSRFGRVLGTFPWECVISLTSHTVLLRCMSLKVFFLWWNEHQQTHQRFRFHSTWCLSRNAQRRAPPASESLLRWEAGVSVHCTAHDVDKAQHKHIHRSSFPASHKSAEVLHIPFHQANWIFVMKACCLQTSAARISCSAHALHWKHWRNDTPERSTKFLRACLAWVVGWNGLKWAEALEGWADSAVSFFQPESLARPTFWHVWTVFSRSDANDGKKWLQ